MARWGWLLLLMGGLAAGTYVFWPAAEESAPGVAVYAGPRPQALVLVAPELRQEVDAQGVLRINSVPRPVAEGSIDRFWNRLGNLHAGRAKAAPRQADLDAAHLGAGAQPPFQVLDGGGRRLLAAAWRTGTDAAEGLVAHVPAADQLAFLDATEAHELIAAFARLDPAGLLPPLDRVQGLGAVDRQFVKNGSRWLDASAPERPQLTGRVNHLLRLLARVELQHWLIPAPSQPPLATCTVELPDGPRQVQLHRDPPLLALQDLPPQAITPELVVAVLAALADLERDFLYDQPPSSLRDPVDRVVVARDGVEWYRLQRREGDDTAELPRWTLLLADQRRLDADLMAADRFVQALLDLEVRAPQRRPKPLDAAPPTGLTVTIIGHGLARPWWVSVSGSRIGGPEHEAEAVTIPQLLREPDPQQALSPLLLGRAAERLVRIQRVRHRPEGDLVEALSRQGTGSSWRCLPLTAKSGAAPVAGEERAVDALAMDRLLRALAGSRAGSVQLYDPAVHAQLAPECSLTVRLAPLPPAEADRAVLEEDTIAQDRAWHLSRHGAGWLAIDEIPERVYVLDEALVDVLFADLEAPVLLPLVSGQVHELRFAPTGGEAYRLRRNGAGWDLRLGDAAAEPADAAAVEAWLLRAGRLEIQRAVGDAVPLLPDASGVRGLIELVVPAGGGGSERFSMVLGATQEGSTVVSVSSSLPRVVPLPGRVWLSAAAVEGLLPAAAAFRDPARLRQQRQEPTP